MGCDIHPILERRWKDERTGKTKWVGIKEYGYTYADVWIGGKEIAKNYLVRDRAKERNYELFAKLAGVRGEGPDPRGMPDDISDMGRMLMDQWGGDGHSHSWCTAEEWCKAALESEHDQANMHLGDRDNDPRIRDPYGYYLGIEIYDPEEAGPQAGDYRIVFCFDN